jgi:hypothetical protein
MWTLLRRIKPIIDEPWLMLGDFNECMWQFEHLSNSRRSERQMQNFRDVLSECDLHDLGYTGSEWTYDNKQGGERNVRVRLDRAVARPDWQARFPNASVSHIVSSRSDHVPILVEWEERVERRPTEKIRRYEAVWEREPTLPEIVKDSWEGQPAHAGRDCWKVEINNDKTPCVE